MPASFQGPITAALMAAAVMAGTSATRAEPAADAARKKIVLIAGTPSHGFGEHDHQAGCMLLAKCLRESGLPVTTEVVTRGWPKDESVLDGADCVVIYADGGNGHPANAHLEKLHELAGKGTGIVCLHYGVEVPKGASGDRFLDWIGGYFETHWSVNPHWTATFASLPEHPVTRGVKPFTINDEWYYHMRFRPDMEGVTPILSDLPPPETLSRPDGPHSGNAEVRRAVLEAKEPQHVAWVAERADGGRGFGFTGGHFHWNWAHEGFRRLVLNAVAWCAGAEVPAQGVPAGAVTVDDMLANHDEPMPPNFDKAGLGKKMAEWNR